MEKAPSLSKKRNFSGDSDNYEFDRNDDEVRPSLGPDGGEAGAVGSGLSLGPGSSADQGENQVGDGVLLQEMRKQFAALSVKLDSIQKSDSTTSREQQERPPKSQSDLALEERFHYARNIQDLLKLNPNLQYDEESNVLFCPCSPQSHFQCPDMEDPDSEEEDQALVQAQA